MQAGESMDFLIDDVQMKMRPVQFIGYVWSPGDVEQEATTAELKIALENEVNLNLA